jgi:hypothetical protein
LHPLLPSYRSTIPLVIYPNYLYNYGEFFMRTVATLHALQAKGWLDKRWVAQSLPQPAACSSRHNSSGGGRLCSNTASLEHGRPELSEREGGWHEAGASRAMMPIALAPTHTVRPAGVDARTRRRARPPPPQPSLTLAVASLGMRLEPYHYFLLRPFSAWNATTLGHLGARLPLATPEEYNPDGQHVRCFK